MDRLTERGGREVVGRVFLFLFFTDCTACLLVRCFFREGWWDGDTFDLYQLYQLFKEYNIYLSTDDETIDD